MYFKYKDITVELSVADFGKKGTFGFIQTQLKKIKKLTFYLM
ncbi:hypothetical protein [Epilithonimonas sp.]